MAFHGAHDVDARNGTFIEVHGDQTNSVTNVYNYSNSFYSDTYTHNSSSGTITDDTLTNNSSAVLRAHTASDDPNLRSLAGGAPTYIIFVNNLSVATPIYWINFEGQREHFKTLSPGQSYQQQTFVRHPWLVCAGPRQYPIAVFRPAQDNVIARIDVSLLTRRAASDLKPLPASTSESDLRSLSGGQSTLITFINALDVPAHVYWINYTGERVFVETLVPLASCQQQTFIHHPFVVCAGSHHTPVVMFQPSLTENRAVIHANGHDVNIITPTAPHSSESLITTLTSESHPASSPSSIP